jgi:carbon monoxide dehydrogenase subunit G
MHLKGSHTFPAPPGEIYEMLMDADTLARITPGVSELEETGPDTYKAIANVRMGPVSGSFSGGLEVADKEPPNGFLLKVKQTSKIGNVSADVKIDLQEAEAGGTQLSFDGKANLSGLLARTGQRVLSGVANTLSKQFFKALEDELKQKA